MISIKKLHDLIDVAINKSHRSIVERQKIDNVINSVSKEVFLDLLAQAERTGRISEWLSPFLVDEPAKSLTGGKLSKPAGYVKYSRITSEDGNPVQVLSDHKYDNKRKDPIDPPTTASPIARITKDAIQVYPTEKKIAFSYWKSPKEAVFGTRMENNVLIYDESASTDLEWNEMLLPFFEARALGRLGLNLRAPDIIEFSEMKKAQETP